MIPAAVDQHRQRQLPSRTCAVTPLTLRCRALILDDASTPSCIPQDAAPLMCLGAKRNSTVARTRRAFAGADLPPAGINIGERVVLELTPAVDPRGPRER